MLPYPHFLHVGIIAERLLLDLARNTCLFPSFPGGDLMRFFLGIPQPLGRPTDRYRGW